MIDNETHKGICVIDLDTVMPGLAMNDFGDSIRFGASTGAEDETDLDKIQCDMNLFDIYAKGFIEGCAGKLTTKVRKTFIKAQSLLVISKDYWPIIRQKPFMKRSKDSMIQEPALKHLKKL